MLAIEARMIPQGLVPIKVYIDGAEQEVARLPMNHVLQRFEIGIEDEAAVAATARPGARLGFCLPSQSWFVLQISGAGLVLNERRAS